MLVILLKTVFHMFCHNFSMKTWLLCVLTYIHCSSLVAVVFCVAEVEVMGLIPAMVAAFW